MDDVSKSTWRVYPEREQSYPFSYQGRVIHAGLWPLSNDYETLPRPAVAREQSFSKGALSSAPPSIRFTCKQCHQVIPASKEVVVTEDLSGSVTGSWHPKCFGLQFEVAPDWSLDPGYSDYVQFGPFMRFGFDSGSSTDLYTDRNDRCNPASDQLPQTRDPRFSSAWGKFDRGLHHAKECVAAVTTVLNERLPVELRFERVPYDSLIRTQVFAKLANDIPAQQWAAIFGDCIFNYRSALEHLVYSLVEEGGGVPDRDTSFPLRTEERPSYGRPILGLSAAALALIEQFQPFNSGHNRDTQHVLGVLQELNNADKHRQMSIVGALTGGTIFEEPMGVHDGESEKNFITEDEVLVRTILAPPEFDVARQVKWQFTPIAIAEGSGLYAEFFALRSISIAVGRVLRSFAALS